MKMKKALSCVVVCAAALSGFAAERFPLASGGKALARIVLEEKPTRAAWFGAFELQHHLKLMTGADFEIVAGGSAEPGRTILVGATPFSKFKPSDFASQQYAVDVRADAIELVGFDGDDRGKPSYAVKDGQVVYSGDPDVFAAQGTMYAVYEFLERTCGVRWCNATDFGTVVPRNADLSVPLGCRRGEPVFSFRGGTAAYGSPAIYWAPRSDEAKAWRELAYANPKRESASRRLFVLRHRSGGEKAPANHSFYHYYDRYWLTNAIDFVEYHPEIFAQGYKNDQKNLPPQLCYTNPKTVELTVREIRQYFDNGGFKKPMRNIAQKGWNWGEGGFALEPMDNASFCRCEACCKLYEPERADENSQHSTIWFRFVNAVAREIRKSHPTKKIRTLAYGRHEGLPTGIRLEENVQVYFCLSCNREMPHSDMFAAQCRRMKEWHGAYPDMKLGVWLYDGFPLEGAVNGGYQCIPGYFAHDNAEQFRFLRENGVSYVHHCGYSGEVCQYVTYALMLDPSRSADELLDEYFSMFGAAACSLRKFYDIIEARWCDGKLRKPGMPIRSPATQWGMICPPETMAKLAKLVTEAERLAVTPEEKRRVELFRRSEWDWMKRGSDTYLQRSSAPMPEWTAWPIAPVEGGAIAKVPWASIPQVETPLYERGGTNACADIGFALRLAHDGKFFYLEIEQRRGLACANIVGHETSGPRDNLELAVARQRARPYRWYYACPNVPLSAYSYGEVNFRNHVPSKEICGDDAYFSKTESVIREPDRWIQRFSFPLEHLADAPLGPGDVFYLTPVLCANTRLLKRTGGQYFVFSPVSFATVHTIDRSARIELKTVNGCSEKKGENHDN